MFENYYDQITCSNPLADVMNIINIFYKLEKMIEKKDVGIINFDGEEFMKFHKYSTKIYLYNRSNKIFIREITKYYYKIITVSLQVDYTINQIENVTSNIVFNEYKKIKTEFYDKFRLGIPPLEQVCNFFCI